MVHSVSYPIFLFYYLYSSSPFVFRKIKMTIAISIRCIDRMNRITSRVTRAGSRAIDVCALCALGKQTLYSQRTKEAIRNLCAFFHSTIFRRVKCHQLMSVNIFSRSCSLSRVTMTKADWHHRTADCVCASKEASEDIHPTTSSTM